MPPCQHAMLSKERIIAAQELQDLIQRLLRRNPSQRLGMQRAGAADVKSHPWFTSFDWALFSRRAMPAPYVPQVSFPPCSSTPAVGVIAMCPVIAAASYMDRLLARQAADDLCKYDSL